MDYGLRKKKKTAHTRAMNTRCLVLSLGGRRMPRPEHDWKLKAPVSLSAVLILSFPSPTTALPIHILHTS